MDIEDTPQSPRLNQRGNIYCPTCKIWTKYEQVIGGIRCQHCQLLIPPHIDPSANSTIDLSDGEIDPFATPSSSLPSEGKDAYGTPQQLPQNIEAQTENTENQAREHRVKLVKIPTRRNLFRNSTPVEMEHQSGPFDNGGYQDMGIPRENIQLPSFSGDDADNVDALVEKLNMYCKLKGLSEQGKLDRIPFCLTGRAFTLFSNLTAMQKRDMDSIIKMLRDNFGKTPLPASVAYQVLSETKMGEKEKVQQFYERLIEKCKGQVVQPEILLSFFLGGLHRDIKSYCLLKNPQSIQDAVALAREAEIVLRANDGSIVSTQTAQQNEINQLQAQMITLLRNKEATVAAIHPMPPPHFPIIKISSLHTKTISKTRSQ